MLREGISNGVFISTRSRWTVKAKGKIKEARGTVSIAIARRLCALDAQWGTGPPVEKSANEVDEFSNNFQPSQRYHDRAP